MTVVVSLRVEADPKAKLPPGAAEAEFAYLKSRAIRLLVDDAPLDGLLKVPVKYVATSKVVAAAVAKEEKSLSDLRVEKSERAIAALESLSRVQQGMTRQDVCNYLQADLGYVKRLKRRDKWRVVQLRSRHQPTLFAVEDVLGSARLRHAEILNQTKRK